MSSDSLHETPSPAASAVVATVADTSCNGSHDAASTAHLSPKQVAAAFYTSYNGDLAVGFERYISKDLVLHGFDGPNERSAWVAGDLELKEALTGFKMDVYDQFAEADKVVTRWSIRGRHTGTILGIPPCDREVYLSGISIDRVECGQSIEHWSDGNFGKFLQEISGETPITGRAAPAPRKDQTDGTL
jgi:predicted ester cyclase